MNPFLWEGIGVESNRMNEVDVANSGAVLKQIDTQAGVRKFALPSMHNKK